MKVNIDQLRQVCSNALLNYGYTHDEALIVQDILVYAQIRGNNQGVVKLIGRGLPKDPNVTPITTVNESSISALLNGGRNLGMLVMAHALDMVVLKARLHGIGIVGTNNTFSSTGAIGYYARKIAEQHGLIGIVAAGSPELVAMYGSYEPIFGTNPLAFGMPTQGTPLVFDMATSAIALFGVIEANTAGRPLPEGVAYDHDGNPTIDAAAALQGAIRTFGGYKGAGLAMMVEVLTRSFVGTKPDANGRKVDWGNLMIAIDPGLLVGKDDYYASVTDIVHRVKATKTLPGVTEIDIPGERGDRIREEAERTGQIEIEDNLWQQLQAVAKR